MAEDITPTPETPPVPSAETPPDLTGLAKAKEMRAEDDPNLAMQSLIAKRQRKTDEKQAKTEEKEPQTEAKTNAESEQKLSGLIANALKFRQKKEEKTAEKPEDSGADGKTDSDQGGTGKAKDTPRGDAPPSDKPDSSGESKTIVTKRKKQPPLPDPVQIATAAATAAVQAAIPQGRTPVPESKAPEEALNEEDRYEYDVAKYLAQTNPKYKDAPKAYLEKIRKASAYAQKWESENPGKIYNPDDEEHNEFYEALPEIWSERDFRAAETALVKSPKEEQLANELKSLKEDNARIELATAVQRSTLLAADQLAKAAGEEIHKKIAANWNSFTEEDPITSQILMETLNGITPVIEAIVQLDEPKGRIRFDPNNQVHQRWLSLIQEKEAQYSGVRDDSGKLFASRNEWYAMNPGQRKQRWFLTPDHLLSELLLDASETVSERVKIEKERLKKIALSLGYVPKSEGSVNSNKSGATKAGEDKKEEKTDKPAQKPVSPSVGSGAKIDAKEDGKKTGPARFLETTASILFRR